MASSGKKKSPLRGLMWSLLFTLVGLAMVAGGVYGMVDTFTDDDDDEPAATTSRVSTPPVDFNSIGANDDCGDLDPRLTGVTELTVTAEKGSGSGKISLRCGGATFFFSIEITGADNPEDYVFADVYLYKSSKDYLKLGTAFYRDTDVSGLLGVPPSAELPEYDSIVIVPRAIGADTTKPKPIAFRATF